METTLEGRLRTAREKRQLSQEEVARALGISVRTVGRYEEGSSPPATYVRDLATLTGADPAWLISGTDSPAHAQLEAIRRIVDPAGG